MKFWLPSPKVKAQLGVFVNSNKREDLGPSFSEIGLSFSGLGPEIFSAEVQLSYLLGVERVFLGQEIVTRACLFSKAGRSATARWGPSYPLWQICEGPPRNLGFPGRSVVLSVPGLEAVMFGLGTTGSSQVEVDAHCSFFNGAGPELFSFHVGAHPGRGAFSCLLPIGVASATGYGRGYAAGSPDIFAIPSPPGTPAVRGPRSGVLLEEGSPPRAGRMRDLGVSAMTSDRYAGGDGVGLSSFLPEALSAGAEHPTPGLGQQMETGAEEDLPNVGRSQVWRSPRVRESPFLPALERAKHRKAVMLEGLGTSSAKLTSRWSSKKVLVKGARCGVKLSEVDAEELHSFMLSG